MGKLGEKLRKIPWKKIGGGILVLVLMALFFTGGYLLMNWYLQRGNSGTSESEYADWQAYSNETYGFGLRYPQDWEATEVEATFIIFKPKADEEGEAEEAAGAELPEGTESEEATEEVKEYVSLAIVAKEDRAKTACEEDQNQCSFHANGIFGDRTSTPETETVFFARGEDDFTLTLYKYNTELAGDYKTLFGKMAASFQFTTQAILACEEDSDCALGIRLDECCTCAEAFTTSEIEANAAVASYEAGKDYSGERTIDCAGVYCSPCPLEPSSAVCVSNRCQVKE